MLAVAVGLVAVGLTRDDAGARAATTALGALVLLLAAVVLAPAAARPFAGLVRPALRSVAGAVGSLAALNVRRNPRRTAATASAVMIGLALVVGITVVTASIRSSVFALVDRTVGADFAVSTSVGQPFATEIGDRIAAVPGVRAVVRQSQGAALLDGQRGGITAIGGGPLDAAFSVDVLAGDPAALDRGGLVVGETAAGDRGWSVGTPVTVTFADGSRRTLTVGAVVADNQVLGEVVVPLEVSGPPVARRRTRCCGCGSTTAPTPPRSRPGSRRSPRAIRCSSSPTRPRSRSATPPRSTRSWW